MSWIALPNTGCIKADIAFGGQQTLETCKNNCIQNPLCLAICFDGPAESGGCYGSNASNMATGDYLISPTFQSFVLVPEVAKNNNNWLSLILSIVLLIGVVCLFTRL